MTVTTLALNEHNDLFLAPDGNIAVLKGELAVGGACETISRTQLGEMVLATTQGLPNFTALWGGVPNYRVWESYLRNALQNVNGVTQVTDLQLYRQDDILKYVATIQTQYGKTQIGT